MPRIPRAYIDRNVIVEGIRKALQSLGHVVVLIRYDLAEDWSGDPAIFFRVLLSDEASKDHNLRATVQRVTSTILGEIDPLDFGLQPYFNFRSESEQRELKEEAWA